MSTFCCRGTDWMHWQTYACTRCGRRRNIYVVTVTQGEVLCEVELLLDGLAKVPWIPAGDDGLMMWMGSACSPVSWNRFPVSRKRTPSLFLFFLYGLSPRYAGKFLPLYKWPTVQLRHCGGVILGHRGAFVAGSRNKVRRTSQLSLSVSLAKEVLHIICNVWTLSTYIRTYSFMASGDLLRTSQLLPSGNTPVRRNQTNGNTTVGMYTST
jgi:hypothetical protein